MEISVNGAQCVEYIWLIKYWYKISLLTTYKLTCKPYPDPGESYVKTGNFSIDSNTAINLRTKATAGVVLL